MGRRGWIATGVASAMVTGALVVGITVGPDPGPPLANLPPLINVGAVNPDVTQDNIVTTICVKHWTDTIRPDTRALKTRLLKALPIGTSHRRGDYELDHVVPLEVGGAPRDPHNLFLQPWTGPTGAHAKDGVEGRVHRLVCDGVITLAVGQHCFLTDWRQCP